MEHRIHSIFYFTINDKYNINNKDKICLTVINKPNKLIIV